MPDVFIIPAKKTDLLRNDNEFCVVHSHNISGLTTEGRSLTASFGELEISEYIQNFLNVYYYVTEHLCNIHWKQVNFYSEILRKVCSQLSTKLDLFFNKKMFDSVSLLNETKIILYITNEFFSELDKKFNKMHDVGKKSKKGMTEDDIQYRKWCVIRENILQFMLSMSTKNLPLLYDPPLPEAQFTDLIADCCYLALKDHVFLKQNSICEIVFQTLGNLIKHYNHSQTFIIRFVNVIKNTEVAHQNNLVLGALQIRKNFELNSIISVLTKEILSMAEKEGSTESIDLKQMMNFLTEVGIQMPSIMVPLLDDIQSLENYSDLPTVRMTYICIISEILRVVYNGDGLNDEDKELRDGMLEDLYDELHDTSALIRSKVLQVFTRLLKEKALPISWLLKIMCRSVGRLVDRGILVRKNAIILLKEFIMHRPIEVPMEKGLLDNNLEEATDKLMCLRKRTHDAQVDELSKKCKEKLLPFLVNAFATEASLKIYEEMATEEASVDGLEDKILNAFVNEQYDDLLKYTIFMETNVLNVRKDRENLPLDKLPDYFVCCMTQILYQIMTNNGTILTKDNEASIELLKDIQKQENIIDLLKMSIKFSEVISQALPVIEQMLYSVASNDSNEAILFFASTLELGIDSAYNSLLRVLYLLVTQKENKDQVYKMMTEIFFNENTMSDNERLDAVRTLDKLSFVIGKMRKCHTVPMNLLFKHLISKDLITPALIQLCWERVTKKHEDTSVEYIYAALIILSFIANYKPNVISTNLSVVTSVLLPEMSDNDIQYAIHTTNMLKNMFLSQAPISKTTSKLISRLPNSDELFEKLCDMLMKFFEDVNTGSFRQLANGVLAIIYAGADQPHILVEKLVSRMLDTEKNTDDPKDIKMCSWRIGRIIHTIGQAAAHHVAFLDVTVYQELGRRKEVTEKTKKKPGNDCFKTPSVNTSKATVQSASRSLMAANASYRTEEENEDDKAVGNAEDAEANFIFEMLEKEILVEPAAFSYALTYVRNIVDNRNKFDDHELQVDATNALVSFMTISSKACSDNMQLLMTVLRHTRYADVKINIIVGCADLLGRFAMVVDPWVSYIIERLKDPNHDVKKTTLKFVCQLILTNVIRPKCYISDVAMFLVDSDESMKNIADHFFKGMSVNEANLYNALPDIISKMTDPAANIEEARFQMIMKSVLRYVGKERHMDGLVQKLCLRLQIAADNKQIRNLAYCLSIINYSVKSMQVLVDNFENFKTTLNIPEVYKIFKDIAAQGQKAIAKPDMKIVSAALDTKIENLFDVNEKRTITEEVAKKSTKKPAKKTQKARSKSVNLSVTSNNDSIASRRPIRSHTDRRQVVIDDSSSSDEEENRRMHKRRS